jgi:hypothetical protein
VRGLAARGPEARTPTHVAPLRFVRGTNQAPHPPHKGAGLFNVRGWYFPQEYFPQGASRRDSVQGMGLQSARQPRILPMPLSASLAALLLVQVIAPEHFFVGRTEGEGRVSVALSGSHGMRARSTGRIEQSGALVVDQILEEEGKPARRLTWRLVRSGANALTGTLTGAVGPVTGVVAGNVLHLRYRSSLGPSVEQWITMHPGGRSASNRMTFSRFGFGVATLEEVIRRVD